MSRQGTQPRAAEAGATATTGGAGGTRVDVLLIAGIALAGLLVPLNSTMLAVALRMVFNAYWALALTMILLLALVLLMHYQRSQLSLLTNQLKLLVSLVTLHVFLVLITLKLMLLLTVLRV